MRHIYSQSHANSQSLFGTIYKESSWGIMWINCCQNLGKIKGKHLTLFINVEGFSLVSVLKRVSITRTFPKKCDNFFKTIKHLWNATYKTFLFLIWSFSLISNLLYSFRLNFLTFWDITYFEGKPCLSLFTDKLGDCDKIYFVVLRKHTSRGFGWNIFFRNGALKILAVLPSAHSTTSDFLTSLGNFYLNYL